MFFVSAIKKQRGYENNLENDGNVNEKKKKFVNGEKWTAFEAMSKWKQGEKKWEKKRNIHQSAYKKKWENSKRETSNSMKEENKSIYLLNWKDVIR